MDRDMIVVELEHTAQGWTFFNPETGLEASVPFLTESSAINHADENGWLIQD